MKWYAAAGAAIFAVLLTMFLVAEAWGVPIFSDPSALLRRADPFAALLGVGLLTADVALPVPSSLVMIALGAGFGAGLGTLLSIVGSMGAMLSGFALGRRGETLLVRFISTEERATADRLLARYGALAIVMTRPVPLLAETVAILAGASPLGWRRATLAALAGTVPAAAIYALAGATAAGSGNFVFVLAAVIVIGGCAWLVERRLTGRAVRGQQRPLTTSVSA